MSGTIYFAYVDPGVPFDDSVHNVQDENVFDLQIQQRENSFATATVLIQNPRQGLLAPARKTRVYISKQVGATVKLLFAGRLVGFPLDFGQETISMEFISQADNWQTTQDAFLQTLKVAPYYNPIFIPEENRNDVAEILSGYSSLVHWNRTTEAISLSDIIKGSTFIDLGNDKVVDGWSSELGDPPVKAIDITVEAQWEQRGLGRADCSEKIRQEFTNTAIGSPQINTLTPLALERGWQGVRVPSGYEVVENKLVPESNAFGLTQGNLRSSIVTVAGVDYPTAVELEPPTRQLTVPRVWYSGTLVLQAEYRQKRRESVSISLTVDSQDISLNLDQAETLSLRVQDPTAVAQGEILDVGKPSFFMNGAVLSTDGIEALEHALIRARARLIKASRVVETTFIVGLEEVIDIDCDTSIRFEDDRLPGGSIRGKVIGYTLNIPSEGNETATVTIASVIGRGTDSTGTGTALGTTVYDNEFGAASMTSEIYYEQTTPPVIAEPIDVATMEADDQYLVVDVTVEHSGEQQNSAIVSQQFPDQYLQNNRTRVEIELRSMNPDAELFADVPIDTYVLTLPNQVNLEAP
jgi:hypothetical protein